MFLYNETLHLPSVKAELVTLVLQIAYGNVDTKPQTIFHLGGNLLLSSSGGQQWEGGNKSRQHYQALHEFLC